MSEGRERVAWQHTSHQLAAIVNGYFGTDKSHSPREFNPYRDEELIETEDVTSWSGPSPKDIALAYCGEQARELFQAADERDAIMGA